MKGIRFWGSEVVIISTVATAIFAALAIILSTIQSDEKERKRKIKKIRNITIVVIFLILLSLVSYLFLQFSQFEKEPPTETEVHDKIAELTSPTQTEVFLPYMQDQAQMIHRRFLFQNNECDHRKKVQFRAWHRHRWNRHLQL